MKTDLKKRKNKNNTVGWLLAALLFLSSALFAGTDPVQELFQKYATYTFEQLMGEYNTVVELHDDIRANIENYMKPGPDKKAIIEQDNNWCSQRQAAWENAIKNRNRQELSTIIVLEYLRSEEMREKYLEGSSNWLYNL